VAIRHAIWLELRFTLSYRGVEDLAERGQISNETIRRWVLGFRPAFARNLRCGRATPHDRRHLDEMIVSIGDPSSRYPLDRRLHHAVVIQIEGFSYRIRQRVDLMPSTCYPRPPSRQRSRQSQ